MKKFLSPVFGLLLLIAMVCSCASPVDSASVEVEPYISDSPLLKDFVAVDEFDTSLLASDTEGNVTKAYLASAPLVPWQENAAETAKRTGTIRYYFMTASGMASSGKWGDACLIAFPNGEVMLVDCGVTAFEDHLMRNLAALGVETIDYLVFSHCHADHTFAIIYGSEFFDYFTVKQCYWNGAYSSSWSIKDRVEKVMAAHNVPLSILSKGDTLQIGDCKVTVLAPVADEVVGKTFDGDENVNGTSIVMRIDYNEVSSLFTGDLYKLTEEELVADMTAEGTIDLLDIDILKTPHHGGRTSSTKALVNAMTPLVAVSTGSYPLETGTYGTYAKVGTYCLMDTLDGYVRIVSDGATYIDVDTSRGERLTKTYVNLDKIAATVRETWTTKLNVTLN